MVDGKIIIELKAVDKLSRLHEAQLLNYLKAMSGSSTFRCGQSCKAPACTGTGRALSCRCSGRGR